MASPSSTSTAIFHGRYVRHALYVRPTPGGALSARRLRNCKTGPATGRKGAFPRSGGRARSKLPGQGVTAQFHRRGPGRLGGDLPTPSDQRSPPTREEKGGRRERDRKADDFQDVVHPASLSPTCGGSHSARIG